MNESKGEIIYLLQIIRKDINILKEQVKFNREMILKSHSNIDAIELITENINYDISQIKFSLQTSYRSTFPNLDLDINKPAKYRQQDGGTMIGR